MKLACTIRSERGKEVTKTGNEEINITLTNERRQKFDIKFTGEKIEVMRYFDASVEVINYDPYKPKPAREPREGICHCGYPCNYGTDYCNRHQTP